MALTRTLQDYVKATVAPYKYPRAIEYVTGLPRTETGKLQRFELRRRAVEGAPANLPHDFYGGDLLENRIPLFRNHAEGE